MNKTKFLYKLKFWRKKQFELIGSTKKETYIGLFSIFSHFPRSPYSNEISLILIMGPEVMEKPLIAINFQQIRKAWSGPYFCQNNRLLQ